MLRSEFLAGSASTVAATTVFPSITPSIYLGVAAPFTGNAKPIGERVADGVRAAMDEFNQLQGTLGRTFAFRTFDDQNTIANALLQASFAVGDSTIVGMIGHVNAEATLRVIPTYANAQMPLVVPLSTDDRITGTQYHNVFRLPTKDSDEGAIFAQYVANQYHPKFAYVFVQNAEYGADVARGFLGVMAGLKIDSQYQQFPYDKPDFGAVVDAALAKNPDYVFLAGIVGDMGPILAVLRAKGYSGPVGASQGFFDAATTKLGPPADGLLVSTSMPYLPLAPITFRWRTDYEEHYGQIQPFSAFGYAAAQVLMAAIVRSNATARNVALSAMLQEVPTDTMTGTYTFTGTGDPFAPEIYFYTMRNGAFAYTRQARPSPFMAK